MDTVTTSIENKTTIKTKEKVQRQIRSNYTIAARKVIHSTWRYPLFKMIFRARTLSSKIFSSIIIFMILASTILVMLNTVESINAQYAPQLYLWEWIFTILFTIEYFLRIVSLPSPKRYIFSPLGIIDLLATFPFYLNVFGTDAGNYFLVLRMVRLFRLFRIFNLHEYSHEATILLTALRASRYKIIIFILAVFISVVMIGSLMFLIEGRENGFTSIPTGIYWAIVTITTVGYGDIVPHTPTGQILAATLMMMGFSTIVVPTSIISSEIARQNKKRSTSNKECLDCGLPEHDSDASYCKRCGSRLWG